jgi:hypothetical protein
VRDCLVRRCGIRRRAILEGYSRARSLAEGVLKRNCLIASSQEVSLVAVANEWLINGSWQVITAASAYSNRQCLFEGVSKADLHGHATSFVRLSDQTTRDGLIVDVPREPEGISNG